MRKFVKRIRRDLLQDDLFERLLALVSGTLSVAFAAFLIWSGLDQSLAIGSTMILIGLFFLAWGGLLVLFCFARAQSRLYRCGRRSLPDPAGLEEAALFLLIVFVPVIFLTLGLRRMGVRGSKQAGSR